MSELVLEKQLLKNWTSVNLIDICDIVYGKNLPIKKMLNSCYSIFRANGIMGKYDKFNYECVEILISCRGISNSFPKISQNDIKELKISFPDVPKQEKIIELIELNFMRLDNLRKNKTKILYKLSKLNNSILKQAFESKLIFQDTDAEPSETLLQKIKQEKEQLKQKEKSKKRKHNVK